MDMCGYHIRCSNYGKNCLECNQLDKNKSKNYLKDVLNGSFENNQNGETEIWFGNSEITR